MYFLSRHSYFIAGQIQQARSRADLKDASDSIPDLIKVLYERGVCARYIARLVTDLNQQIFRRLYEDLVDPDRREFACLIVMGSEGRGEQLLHTDQDNGLILQEGLFCGSLAAKTREFTQALIDLGYPLCPGNVMVSNPAWAKSLADFKTDVFHWIYRPDKNAFMNLAIFYDAISTAGDSALLQVVKDYLLQRVHDQRTIIRNFARAILLFETPLGWFDRFRLERTAPGQSGLDIKKGGIFPIVHGVRSLALEHRLGETNTIARIYSLSGQGLFNESFTADLIEAFDFMSLLRLRVQLACWEQGEASDNYIYPGQLNKLERNLLKDSLKIVKEFKSFIGYHFKLNLLS